MLLPSRTHVIRLFFRSLSIESLMLAAIRAKGENMLRRIHHNDQDYLQQVDELCRRSTIPAQSVEENGTRNCFGR